MYMTFLTEHQLWN